jgi:hypothetical protein
MEETHKRKMQEMISSLSVDSNPQTWKDGKRLNEINLVDEEQIFLKKFAEANLLDGNTYTTISLIH